ncbi:MAG: aminotransferase class I/II-fold pyridoxal phosphate-dependent enzyme [Gemmatimonadota bacterium]|nr:aminotransferase class I/II-fold pyridoxal phosphate-dependent enzyme [Gemmatimonadota bacterium]
MSLSRRTFVRTFGVGSAGALTLPAWLNARGLEAGTFGTDEAVTATWRDGVPIKLDSNENPHGPAPAAVRAIEQSFRRASLYPSKGEQEVRDAIAKANGVAADQVMLGCGSGEILRLAVQAFCTPTRHLVAAKPTFETPAKYAEVLGLPVREVPVDGNLALDLKAMLAQVKGAGLVFLCNPNNPTGHVHGKAAVTAFVEAALQADPEVIVLIDEAYHEFVADPSYGTSIPMVSRHPRVVVSRTFSKIYGLAGMRLGYAFGAPATLTRMERLRLDSAIGGLTQAAGVAALADPMQVTREHAANLEARTFTIDWFTKAGYAVVPSQTNFILAHIKRDSAKFKDDCAAQGVLIGRVFPPLTQHTRISIGTLAEMKQAVQVFGRVLA